MIYLDNAGTTPLSQGVKDYLISILDNYGNPSSIHQIGIESRKIIDNARKIVAKFINAEPDNIIFTSGGSASNTLAILGFLKQCECTVFYSPLLHKSALKCIEDCTISPEKLKVNNQGFIDIKDFENRTNPLKYKPFVVVEWANSEIGTIQNIKEIINVTRKHGGICYVDATASVGSIPIDVTELDADMLGFSGHKFHALKGIGVLYKKSEIKLAPLVYGSQEKGLFAGTENILGISSLGKAIEELDYSSISSYDRDYVWNYIQKNIPDAYLIGAPIGENRLKHNLYVCFKGIEGESLQMLLDVNEIQVSTGSACNSGSLEPSSTLTAIGMNENDAHSCIRITFGHERLSREELDYVCESIRDSVEILRSFNK